MTQPRRKSEEMFPLVEAYLEGHQTMKAFCLEQELPEYVFMYWLRKYRRQVAVQEPFVEITPSSASEPVQPLVELLYPGGIRLRLFMPVPPSYLAPLVGVEPQGR